MSKSKLIIFLISNFVSYLAIAQEDDKQKVFTYAINNSSEAQYNLSDKKYKKAKLINLFAWESTWHTDRVWKNGSFHFNMWAVVQSIDERIADDDLTFSNLEAANNINVSQLGYEHRLGNLSLFGGIRNMSLDYFTSPYSSLFTNSCAGIFPTISMNYGVANYPIAGMGIHAEYDTENFNFKNSFYNNLNGVNPKKVVKYQFNPHKDGYTNISQASYASSNSFYAIGSALEKLPNTKLNGSIFGIAEQELLVINQTRIGAIGQFGYAPDKDSACRSYWGIGAVVTGLFNSKGKDVLGISVHSANLIHNTETDAEITYQYKVSSRLSIQPAIHYVKYDERYSLVGLIRVALTLGN